MYKSLLHDALVHLHHNIPPGLYRVLNKQYNRVHSISQGTGAHLHVTPFQLETYTQIIKDVKRSKHLDSSVLRSVLYSIAVLEPTGYCQGMHFLMSYLLSVLNNEGEIVLRVFDTFIYEFHFDTYWDAGFTGVKHDLQLLSLLIEKRLPYFHNLLKQHEIVPEMFALRWFLCFFTTDVEDTNCLDFIFLYILERQRKALIHVAFVVCKEANDIFLEDSPDTIEFILRTIEQTCRACTVNKIMNVKVSSGELN
jgi:hypothetical protein